MKRQPIRSTSLKAVGYDADTQTLEIEYRNGRVVRYSGVSEAVHQGLRAVPGKALFVTQVLDGGPYQREQVR
ncbi:KTSC domain-containing protein [Hymenobacter daecheongensis DSM 21074]|uniref:KTSC domain-containing protein n=1 Tax=Hymenobacter daecheongensis DSM 21074 TaxID=1121955 RepID=A0A1M6I6V5_9BACT|nr:KTSC domain-containing protein [Hymenobacter daecheongensis]SHJ30144.1 KTSC domain-containing protein [Hymenobacter daecheongensis DSM 21074]